MWALIFSGWLHDFDDYLIKRISQKASAIANLSLETAEPLQVRQHMMTNFKIRPAFCITASSVNDNKLTEALAIPSTVLSINSR